MNFVCRDCGNEYSVKGNDFQCACGGLFDYRGPNITSRTDLISLGEPVTPVVNEQFGRLILNLKLDYFMPTGSFKDRGARTLISAINKLGIKEIVEDSSGNAGAAIAAYAAAAGMNCQIYVPESASGAKLKQIKSYGAQVVTIPGSRQDTAEAVKKACREKYYASHIFNPLFFEGTKTIAHEIVHQLGYPKSVVVPVGNGSLLIGLYRGFAALGKIPELHAIQSENCAPLHNAYKGLTIRNENIPGKKNTSAKGIAVPNPPRLPEMIRAIDESGGSVTTVSDEHIISAKDTLHKRGIYIETTAAVGVAGAINLYGDQKSPINTVDCHTPSTDGGILVPLTGSGLKEL